MIKVAKPLLWTEPTGSYWFEKSSPFAEKFGKISQRIQETNLIWIESLKHGSATINLDKESEMKFFDEIDVKQLFFLLFCGYMLAIPTFFAELIVFKVEKLRKYYLQEFNF